LAKRFIVNNQVIQLRVPDGTLNYMPPQMHNYQPYSGEKADIFSLGAILFALVTGINGFGTSKNDDPYYRFIRNGNINVYWKKVAPFLKNANNLSLDFKNLYISMVASNENIRPNIAQILQHHWFNEINILNNEQLIDLENNVRNEFAAREPHLIQDIHDLDDYKVFQENNE
jgi:serine/threonine protein kinase